ncbi:hypothetical protein HC251_25075 (plasmid) [Iamia sp. SCSIO 61187]|uniref:hypothetical protein n=1 Tax=Iamia sp. SCSIO 61187 TaxID=2722752 RepID=UPI001C635379|nr:hypothetical protein [Iamia sp. SCSIO 61187]QYG94361.1 hypothetical protein HC251_19265 [Iamia sp. SCSIO 61187]QYG95823.1 hypothetical protein HC251_25075 [Iamia sp. SCSIO 61187]
MVALALAATLLGCSDGGGGSRDSGQADGGSAPAALPANFDLAADSPQPFLLGLIGAGQESIAYGTIDLAFEFVGPRDDPLSEPRPGQSASASFQAVSGKQIDPATPGPKAVSPSTARGVYATEPLSFPDAGYWNVSTQLSLEEEPVTVTAVFEVLEDHKVSAVGTPAPRTENPLAGDDAVPPAAIDSRARDDEPIPDPELHEISVADALAAGRPFVVVVSTPTYCTSLFCGPITDTVGDLSERYADRMEFVHLEVWADYEGQDLNPAAAEWIQQEDGEGNEPWTFVVDAMGVITHRFDNFANEDVLERAIEDTLAA